MPNRLQEMERPTPDVRLFGARHVPSEIERQEQKGESAEEYQEQVGADHFFHRSSGSLALNARLVFPRLLTDGPSGIALFGAHSGVQ